MARALQKTLSRVRRMSHQQVRYLLVGASMAALFALLVWGSHSVGLRGWVASALSTMTVAVPTFLLHRYFTFDAPGPLIPQLAGYLTTVAFNVPVGMVTVYLLLDVLGVHAFISGLAATVVASLLNYLLLSRLVFRPSAASHPAVAKP